MKTVTIDLRERNPFITIVRFSEGLKGVRITHELDPIDTQDMVWVQADHSVSRDAMYGVICGRSKGMEDEALIMASYALGSFWGAKVYFPDEQTLFIETPYLFDPEHEAHYLERVNILIGWLGDYWKDADVSYLAKPLRRPEAP